MHKEIGDKNNESNINMNLSYSVLSKPKSKQSEDSYENMDYSMRRE